MEGKIYADINPDHFERERATMTDDEISAPERPDESEKTSETNMGSLSEQEIEDLQWPAVRKGWVRYWRVRLNRDASFDEIRTIIRKLRERAEREGVKGDNTWRKIREQKKKEKKRLQKMNRDQQSEVVKIEDLTRIDDPVVQNEGRILEDSIEHISQANEIILEQFLPDVASDQEKRDLAMNTSTKGWINYWIKRLATELDILPPNVRKVIETHITTRKIKGIRELQLYINQRVGTSINQKAKLQEKPIETRATPENSVPIKLQQYVARRVDILRFQVEKRAQMVRLKAELRRVDAQEDLPEQEKHNRKVVAYDVDTQTLFIVENGNKKNITIGDIVGDLEWGIKYRPDKSVPHLLWRKIRKLSALKEARGGVEEIFNREIAHIEHIGLPTSSLTVDFIEQIYTKDTSHGIIAERMIQSQFLRIIYDHPELHLHLEHSNAIEDAELKYDFKLIIPVKTQGVAIEGDELLRNEYVQEKRKVGIQFTVSSSRKELRPKEEKIKKAKKKISSQEYFQYVRRPVDDIVLVSVPLDRYKDCFKEWLSMNKPSGGPEQYLTKEEKIYFLKKATKGLINLSDDHIEKLVKK